MQRLLQYILVLILTGAFLNAQELRGKAAERVIADAEAIIPNFNSAFPKLVDFKKNSTTKSDDFFDRNRDHLNISKADRFDTYRVEADQLGMTHYRVKQYHKGLEVIGAEYILHEMNGRLKSANGYIQSGLDIDIQPFLSEEDAFNKAISSVSAEKYKWETEADAYSKPEAKLAISSEEYLFTPESYKLVYRFDIYSEKPLGRYYVDVDAKTGEIINKFNRIHSANVAATGNSKYNGTVSFTADNTGSSHRLRQTAYGNGIQTYDMNNGTNYGSATDVTSSSSNFGNTDRVAVQAHWGAERTYEYYNTAFSRNSYDNNGAVIRSYVHYSSNYANAFWDGQRMTYGDGNATQGFDALVSLDICGHEITHAVTEKSANLVYSYESGALNESFSDIFGEMIENYAAGPNDWLMGDDMDINGDGIRNMANPNADGDPDTYKGTNWHTGASDNGGVHTNSGVQNFWFYLLSVGGSGTNDKGTSYSVSAIGRTKAAAIAYRNLTVYLTTNSNYSDAYVGSRKAATDLYGSGSSEYNAVTEAWKAVGVDGSNAGGGTNPGGGGGGCFLPLNSLVSNQLAALAIKPTEKTQKLSEEFSSKYNKSLNSIFTVLAKSPQIQYDLYEFVKKNLMYFNNETSILSKKDRKDLAGIVDRTRSESSDLVSRKLLAKVSAVVSSSDENTSYEKLLEAIYASLDSDLSDKIPAKIGLEQNYPNPFNPVTTIKFNLQKNTLVKLRIYNSLGQEVIELVSKEFPAGSHEVKWDAKEFASGIYFMQLTTNEFSQSKKMILLK